jgi:hypothetical protein
LTWSSTRYYFDSDNNLVDVGPTIRWYVKDPDGEEQAELYKVEHEKSKRLFVLTGPDGQREHFRDNPARQLLVEPDPSTGGVRPVMHDGKPVYVYLCRKERENV